MGPWVVWLGLASPMALAYFLDRHINSNLKARLARTVLRVKEDGGYYSFEESLNQLSESLQKFRLVKVSFFVAMSLIGILFIYSSQYLLNYEDFNDYTLPFLNTFFFNPFKFILYFACFVIVDCISFFQTYRFFLLTKGANGYSDIFFIIFADIFLSLSLVILLLPLLVSATYYITSPPQENDIYLLIDNKRSPQPFTLSQFVNSIAPQIEINSPSNTAEREEQELFETTFGDEWIHTLFSLEVETYVAGKSIADAVEDMEYGAGAISILYTYNTDVSELGKYLEKIAGSVPALKSVEILDSSETPFENRIVIYLRIKGGKKAALSDIFSSYFDNLGNFNFINNQLKKIRSVSNMGVDENSILRNALFYNWSPHGLSDITLICDADKEPQNLKISEQNAKEKIEMCENGVLVSRAFLSMLSGIVASDYSSHFLLPILPTAWSSLLLTAFIYALALIWFVSPVVGLISDRIIQGGVKTIENNIFKISFGLMVVVLGLLALIFGKT